MNKCCSYITNCTILSKVDESVQQQQTEEEDEAATNGIF
jgi:hypothetical protein